MGKFERGREGARKGGREEADVREEGKEAGHLKTKLLLSKKSTQVQMAKGWVSRNRRNSVASTKKEEVEEKEQEKQREEEKEEEKSRRRKRT